MPPKKPHAERALQAVWRSRGVAAWLLLPLAAIFVGLRTLRRLFYRLGLLRSESLPVPVVVVGNISVGGAGKTPLVAWLASALQQQGWQVGIISRGYGGQPGAVHDIDLTTAVAVAGDEPLLLRRRTGCPVAVGADRVAAARHLLACHPQTNVIISDDGLQHYRLGRRLEIAVTSAVAEGNGWPLPAGPLREGRDRLATVDAIVVAAEAADKAAVDATSAVSPAPTFRMSRRAGRFHALHDPAQTQSPAAFIGKRLHAVAGIGQPQGFFDLLGSLGLTFETHIFADHHAYVATDLMFAGDAILSTEKDAVKLLELPVAPLPVWIVSLEIVVEPDLARFVVEKLNGPPPL